MASMKGSLDHVPASSLIVGDHSAYIAFHLRSGHRLSYSVHLNVGRRLLGVHIARVLHMRLALLFSNVSSNLGLREVEVVNFRSVVLLVRVSADLFFGRVLGGLDNSTTALSVGAVDISYVGSIERIDTLEINRGALNHVLHT